MDRDRMIEQVLAGGQLKELARCCCVEDYNLPSLHPGERDCWTRPDYSDNECARCWANALVDVFLKAQGEMRLWFVYNEEMDANVTVAAPTKKRALGLAKEAFEAKLLNYTLATEGSLSHSPVHLTDLEATLLCDDLTSEWVGEVDN